MRTLPFPGDFSENRVHGWPLTQTEGNCAFTSCPRINLSSSHYFWMNLEIRLKARSLGTRWTIFLNLVPLLCEKKDLDLLISKSLQTENNPMSKNHMPMNAYPYFIHDRTHWDNVGLQQWRTCLIYYAQYSHRIEYYAVVNWFFLQSVLNDIEKTPNKLLNEKRWNPNLQY